MPAGVIPPDRSFAALVLARGFAAGGGFDHNEYPRRRSLPGRETIVMPRPVPVPVRQKLWERSQRGETTASLAYAFDLSPHTVRRLLKRFRDRGPAALRPDYHRPTRLPNAYPDHVREAALALRREHPDWSAALIRSALSERGPNNAWPELRTLQRWFRSAGLGPASPPQRPPRVAGRAHRPH